MLSGRRRARGLAGAASLAILSAVAFATPGAGLGAGDSTKAFHLKVGHSVKGKPIVATRVGDPDADRVVLVVGQIHGDEPAGIAVIGELLRSYRDAGGIQLWVLRSLNPDGNHAGTRKNAHGVDLNRNFSTGWSGGVPPSSGYYPGPKPFSEPESRAARRLINRIKPDVTVWYHQPWGAVLACHGKPALAKRYAKLVKMKTSCRGKGLHGTAREWQDAHIKGSVPFVVELRPGALSKKAVRRHARAVLKASR